MAVKGDTWCFSEEAKREDGSTRCWDRVDRNLAEVLGTATGATLWHVRPSEKENANA